MAMSKSNLLSSSTNPFVDVSFRLEMKPARALGLAFEALADPQFNNNGLGVFGANHNSFGVKVDNFRQDTSFLKLYPSSLLFYQCLKPIVGGSVPLGLISDSFPDSLVDDDDTVSIYHFQGSFQLSFKFTGPTSSKEFSVPFLEHSFQSETHPLPTVFCQIPVPNKQLRKVIDYMLQDDSPSVKTVEVSADIEEGIIRMEIGGRKSWQLNYKQNKASDRELDLDQCQRASFNMIYPTFLYKASFMGFYHVLQFTNKRLCFHFKINKSGVLKLRQQALVFLDALPRINEKRKQRSEAETNVGSKNLKLF